MLLIIILTDQLLWRPLIAWSDRFKFENRRKPARAAHLVCWNNLQQSRALHARNNSPAPLD
jgi:NitT/TauT family transport system permease protein